MISIGKYVKQIGVLVRKKVYSPCTLGFFMSYKNTSLFNYSVILPIFYTVSVTTELFIIPWNKLLCSPLKEDSVLSSAIVFAPRDHL